MSDRTAVRASVFVRLEELERQGVAAIWFEVVNSHKQNEDAEDVNESQHSDIPRLFQHEQSITPPSLTEFSGAIAAVAVLLMAGSALAANECAGLPHSSPHPRNALSDFFVGVSLNPEAHEQQQRGIVARATYEALLAAGAPEPLAHGAPKNSPAWPRPGKHSRSSSRTMPTGSLRICSNAWLARAFIGWASRPRPARRLVSGIRGLS
jgi:hypothetical protein